MVGFSMGAQRSLVLAARHPERVAGLALIAPSVPLGSQGPRVLALASFDERHETHDGWRKYNRHFWLDSYAEFLQFFFANVYTEPHSTKQIEDCVGWGLETSPETLVATADAPALDTGAIRELGAQVRCPVLVIHGTEDAIRTPASGAALAEVTGATFVSLEGSGTRRTRATPSK